MSFFRTFKFRLIALGVVLIVIGVLVRQLVILPTVRDRVHEVVADAQLSIVNHVARDLAHALQARRTLIGELADTLPAALLSQPLQLGAWLDERERLNPLFDRGLRVLGPDGARVAGSSRAAWGEGSAAPQADWLQAALGTQGAVISRPQRAEGDGAPVVVMAAAVRDGGGRALAVVAGELRLDEGGFLEDLRQTQLGESGGFVVISPADKLFVASNDAAMVLRPTPGPGVDPMLDRALTGYRGTGLTVDAQGEDELAAIAAVPDIGWIVVARRPTAEVSQPVAELRRLLWRNSFATMAVLSLILLGVLSHMLRPLTNASRAIREMADGKQELAPVAVTRQDEFGDLLFGFNNLVTRLHDKEQALLQTLKQLDALAGTDALTGAWNRRQFYQVVALEVERAHRYRHPLALILLDVDLFKGINDRYGHMKGDEVLQAVATSLRSTLRKADSLTRWGGEEFVVLLPETDLASATVFAERARVCIAAHAIDGVGAVTASFGVAELGEAESRNDWIARADAALYRAKQGGRNRVEADDAVVGHRGTQEGFIRLVWHASFESGDATLDAEHRALFDEINVLWTLIAAQHPAAEIRATVEVLYGKMVRHFRDEEALLQRISYPELAAHIRMHEALTVRADALIEELRCGKVDFGTLFAFLAHDMVAKHIVGQDRAYFAYLDTAASRPDHADALPAAARDAAAPTPLSDDRA
ncbi:diguanylate cyclase [Aromatoleum petrolei]|uniref:diguanylate cyclase n=1 Tax=Aromatoleum petrolei TaxID=76116 RepID=A0ABX1MJ50_9RHOO|nr:diguanylate cyclase [Aromatoleum petrolei]NMF87967.1 diguanylate cyclase [Aromatoleum petrolei]QTQ36664.1 Diguanylate cyclase/phosphodiesterase, PAS domain-containing [Aromatoleum petrolei]